MLTDSITILKMTKAQLISYIESTSASFSERHVTGFDGWSRDELEREALGMYERVCLRAALEV